MMNIYLHRGAMLRKISASKNYPKKTMECINQPALIEPTSPPALIEPTSPPALIEPTSPPALIEPENRTQQAINNIKKKLLETNGFLVLINENDGNKLTINCNDSNILPPLEIPHNAKYLVKQTIFRQSTAEKLPVLNSLRRHSSFRQPIPKVYPDQKLNSLPDWVSVSMLLPYDTDDIFVSSNYLEIKFNLNQIDRVISWATLHNYKLQLKPSKTKVSSIR